ncbi:MAG TPA: hypothetical protein VFX98_07715 [Longimicrobiaceae bacterium]|nr:hypothetical protein [Longimicrobiaceae bacterium]
MSGYLGRYQRDLDEKGRLSLPASFRRGGGEEPLVLVHAFPNALTLYPDEAWAGVEGRLRELMRLPEGRAYALRMSSSALPVTPDKQGRILVPQWLQEAAGITGPVLVVGAIDKIELWDPARFAAETDAPAPEVERFRYQIF